ncbi:MAG TPA: DUF1937 family protein [Rhabdochlamydiaceae bacterium]
MELAELIYLACPFRHADPQVQRKRCAAAHYTAAQLSSQGRHVFSPLTHNAILIDILQDSLPGEHWMQFDLAILAGCKYLFVLKMEGWELSKGVRREILFAQERGIQVEEIEPPSESEYLDAVLSVKLS